MTLLQRVRVRSALGLVFAFFLTVALPSHQGGAQGTPTETLTFVAGADVYVDGSKPTRNYDGDDMLKADASPARIVYLRFAVTGVNGRTVQSARLMPCLIASACPVGPPPWTLIQTS